MENPKTHLTGNLPPQKSGSLLDVNERLHNLAPRLRERKSEDVVEAMRLVTEFGDIVGVEKSEADLEFERIQQLLPEAELERFSLDINPMTADEIGEALKEKNIDFPEATTNVIESTMFNRYNKPLRMDLVSVRINDLHVESELLSDLESKIDELKLVRCSPVVPAYFRLKYEKQPIGESVYVFTAPTLRLVTGPVMFCVWRHMISDYKSAAPKLAFDVSYIDDPEKKVDRAAKMLFLLDVKNK